MIHEKNFEVQVVLESDKEITLAKGLSLGEASSLFGVLAGCGVADVTTDIVEVAVYESFEDGSTPCRPQLVFDRSKDHARYRQEVLAIANAYREKKEHGRL